MMKNFLAKLIPGKIIPCSALDIGTRETKLVSLLHEGGAPVVTHTVRYPTPPGFWTEDIYRESNCTYLQEVMLQHDPAGTPIISVIGGDSVITRHVSLPKAAKKELTGAVIKEAQKVVPSGSKDLLVRYIVLGEPEDKKELEVLFAALPLSISYQYHALLKRCGFELVALDLPAIALWRLFRNELAQNEDAAAAIIDIGESKTCMLIAKGQHLQYTRMMPGGGDLLNSSMADVFAINTEQARIMKEDLGAILDAGSLAGADATARQIDLSLRDGLGQIIKEIRRSIDFYITRGNAAPLKQVILSGGTSKLNGFEQFISEALDLPASLTKPTSILFDASGQLSYDPAMAIAYGLALRELQANV